jgi:hypothetical protein
LFRAIKFQKAKLACAFIALRPIVAVPDVLLSDVPAIKNQRFHQHGNVSVKSLLKTDMACPSQAWVIIHVSPLSHIALKFLPLPSNFPLSHSRSIPSCESSDGVKYLDIDPRVKLPFKSTMPIAPCNHVPS